MDQDQAEEPQESEPGNNRKELNLITWKKSFSVGSIITLLLAALAFFVPWFIFPNLAVKVSVGAGLSLLVVALVGLDGLRQIPVAYRGVPLYFGRRIDSFVFDEGYQWVGPLPGIFSYATVSIQEQTTKIDKLQVLTKDNVKVNFTGTLIWRVAVPYQYLQVTDKIISDGLNDLFDEVIRHETRGKSLDDVSGAEFGKDMRNAIFSRAEDLSESWGVDIVRIIIPEALPDPEVIKDLELVRREEAQKKGQVVELEHFRDRVKELKEMGFSLAEAQEIVQLAIGRITKQVNETKISASQPVLDLLEKGGTRLSEVVREIVKERGK